jgi:copper chaperone
LCNNGRPEQAELYILKEKKMDTLQFKTNINCGGCVAKIAPTLNERKDIISHWKVDTLNPDRILTVETTATAAEVKALVAQAGFQARDI